MEESVLYILEDYIIKTVFSNSKTLTKNSRALSINKIFCTHTTWKASAGWDAGPALPPAVPLGTRALLSGPPFPWGPYWTPGTKRKLFGNL